MMESILPDWQAPANVNGLSTLRGGGTSRAPYDDGQGGGGFNLGTHVGDDRSAVEANRRALRHALPAEPVWLNQVHGVRIVDAADAFDAPDADASIATRPGVVCAIMTADCLPVLLHDDKGRAVGAAHAGWRGLAGGVLQLTVEVMRSKGCGQIGAWLGPAIGPGKFEVGQDVRHAFVARDVRAEAAFFPIPAVPGKYLADIYHLARLALDAVGVTNVSGGHFCTVTDVRRFYSYRRDGRTGRMASLIWMTDA